MTDPERATESSGNEPSWRELLRELDLTPSRSRGQNFLHDRKIVRRIAGVAEIDQETDVVEVGPGLGILTSELVKSARSVTAIELDRRLAGRLQHEFAGSARIIEGDVLQVDLAELLPPGPYVVVANLPYSIATAVIQRFLECSHAPRRMVIMVQREVAERMVDRPPAMSILAVAIQFYAAAKIMFRVGSGAFIPAPRVESAVVRLDLYETPSLPVDEHAGFFKLVRAGFSQRRKRLDNAIASSLKADKAAVAGALKAAGIEPSRRAETLQVADWVELYEYAVEFIGD